MDEVAARQLAQTLTFKVEAVPQEGVSPTRSSGNMTPLNVKIRVRKKDDGKSPIPKGIIFVPKSGQAENLTERLRLASSDHTILSFNMLMETEHERKRKNRKNTFFGNCLGAQTDDEDGPYLPTTDSRSESRFAKIKLKNIKPDEIGTSQALMRKNTDFFGVCKPGGCLDPPYGEDRYAYQPAPLRLSTRSESNTKGVVIIPPIRIEPSEAVETDMDERLRNSFVKVDPKELMESDPDDKPEKDKDVKGKEVSNAERRLSSDDQDRNKMRIEKLRKTASSNRPSSNEFNTLFFSPPRKDSSKDSGSSRRDSKLLLQQRKNTNEAVKTPIPLSRKDDKDKQRLGSKIDDKIVSGKQISSAPILILSDTEIGDTTDQNRYPETHANRSRDQHQVPIILRGEEPANVTAMSIITFPTSDKNKVKEHDSMQISIQEEHTPIKHIPKDTADIAKQRRNMPSTQLSDILSSDVTESQQDVIIESEKGSLVMSPITEIIIPPAGKIIKISQTDDLVKRKSESSGENRKRSSSQSTKNNTADPSKTTEESTLKVPIKIEKLRGLETVKPKLPDDNSKAMSPKNLIDVQQTDEPQISLKLSDPIELVNIIKQPISISKENSDKKQEINASQNPITISDQDLIDYEIQKPVTKIVEVNQYQSKGDEKILKMRKFSDQMKIVDHAERDDFLKDKQRPSISSNRSDISVKTKNEDTQLQSDQPKKDLLVIAQNRDSNASGYKKDTDDEIKIQPHQLLNEDFKYSPQLQEYHNKSDQDIIAIENVQKLKYTPAKQSESLQPTIAQDSPNVNYQKVDDNQNHYPSTIQDTKITQAYDTNEQQLFEPKEGKDLEEKTQKPLDDSQVSTKGANRDDPHYINLVFQKITYDNKTGIKTLDADANFEADENIVTYKSNSPAQDKKITIPIDGQNVVAIKIKKSSSTGDNDRKEVLAPHSNIHKVSDSSKGEYEAQTLKGGMFYEPQNNYTDGNDAGFEMPPTKRRSIAEDRYDSKSETGAKIYSPKQRSIPENRKASLSTRNSADPKMLSSTFDGKPKSFDGSYLETSKKLSKRGSEYNDSRGSLNKRGSFTPDRVDLKGDRSGTGSKVTSPRQSAYNEETHVLADSTYGVEPTTSPKWGIVGERRSYSRDDRKSTEATMSPYKRNSVKSNSILDTISHNHKQSTLLDDTESRTYLPKHLSRDDRATSKGEFFSFTQSSNIAGIDRNHERNSISRQSSTISGRDPLGRSGIVTSDDPRDFFDDSGYDRNITYTNRTDTETDIPTLYDATVPTKRISSFVNRTDSKPSISSFRQISLTTSKKEPLDEKSEVNKRSFLYYGENRSGSTYGKNESGARMRSSKETYNEADYTGDIDDDRNIGVIKYDSFFDTRKVDSFIKDKSGQSRDTFYPYKDDKASYSKADKTIQSGEHSRSRSVDRDDTNTNKRISHEEGNKEGKDRIYFRSIDISTDFQSSKNGSRAKVVKYSEDDSRIAIIGREINRTLSFIYEHELIPLQHVIKGLKEDIDVLAEQQVLLREKLHGPKRVRPVRKCGCSKRYDFSSILE